MEGAIAGDSGDGESKEKSSAHVDQPAPTTVDNTGGVSNGESSSSTLLNVAKQQLLCDQNDNSGGDVAESNSCTTATANDLHVESNDDDSCSDSAVDFIVVYNKKKYDITFNSNKTVKDLKGYLQGLIGVPSSVQKVMFKGLAKDEQTLKDLDVKSGAKVMVVGSKLDQIMAVSASTAEDNAAEEKAATCKEPFCKQKIHKKVLDKGVPDDVMVGIKNVKDPLPPHPLSGMLNKMGGKVRLTFKLELDQLWIGTKERTDKITMNTIKSIVSEPIENHEEYHIMGFQLGTTEASRYWVYWVPAQYVDSIKSAILGTWML